jgi:single-stranded-DNA-specific exonuclease
MGKHLKLRVAQEGKAFDVLGWQMAEQAAGLAGTQMLDLAFTLDANVFQNTVTLQLILKDWQPGGR